MQIPSSLCLVTFPQYTTDRADKQISCDRQWQPQHRPTEGMDYPFCLAARAPGEWDQREVFNFKGQFAEDFVKVPGGRSVQARQHFAAEVRPRRFRQSVISQPGFSSSMRFAALTSTAGENMWCKKVTS